MSLSLDPSGAHAGALSILVVDDDRAIRELLAGFLARHGMAVTPVADGAAMWPALAAAPVDLIVLDLNLPGVDGIELCRRLRAAGHAVPVIMLTARSDPIDRIVGLEIGADDYLAKPFEPRELAARIRTVLRRSGGAASAHVAAGAEPARPAGMAVPDPAGMSGHASVAAPATGRWGFDGWTLDVPARRLLSPSGQVVMLTSGEFRLLRVLVEHAGQVLSRDQLMNHTKGRDASPFDRSIDLHVSRLRAKLRDDAREPRLLQTVRNEGYLLTATVHALR